MVEHAASGAFANLSRPFHTYTTIEERKKPMLLSLLMAVLAEGDAELIKRLQSRDPQALAEIYDRYGRVAYSLILRVVRDAAIAEDTGKKSAQASAPETTYAKPEKINKTDAEWRQQLTSEQYHVLRE